MEELMYIEQYRIIYDDGTKSALYATYDECETVAKDTKAKVLIEHYALVELETFDPNTGESEYMKP